MEVKINLNSWIKFKLTDYGEDKYYEHYDEFNKIITQNGGKALTLPMLRTDKDGYTYMQLWEFMNKFGKYMILGNKDEIINPLEIIYEMGEK